MSISNRVAILAQSITFVYLLSFGQCELRVGVLVLIAAVLHFQCVYTLSVYMYIHMFAYVCICGHKYVFLWFISSLACLLESRARAGT